MVRTKQPRRPKSIRDKSEGSDPLVKDFERQAAQRIHKIKADLSMQLNMLTNSIELAMSSLPTEIRKLTLGDILAMDECNENDVTMEVTNESSEISTISKTVGRPKKAPKRATTVSDDGYATESTTNARTTHVSRINETKNSEKRRPRNYRSSSNGVKSTKQSTRTTRSASRSRNSRMDSNVEQESRNNLLKTAGRCPSSSAKYKTPSMKNQGAFFNVVTPKITPNTPLNIMRRPRQGEMVLSMQGSPLLVSSIVQERTANINVPLRNGDIISLLPNPGLRLSHMPTVDDETMRQLKTLNNHLMKVMGSK